MFLHLGGDTVIPITEIISIMNIKSSCNSKITKEFINISHEDDFINCICEERDAKSFILTERDHQTIIYLSPISSVTLLKRSNFYEEVILNNKIGG